MLFFTVTVIIIAIVKTKMQRVPSVSVEVPFAMSINLDNIYGGYGIKSRSHPRAVQLVTDAIWGDSTGKLANLRQLHTSLMTGKLHPDNVDPETGYTNIMRIIQRLDSERAVRRVSSGRDMDMVAYMGYARAVVALFLRFGADVNLLSRFPLIQDKWGRSHSVGSTALSMVVKHGSYYLLEVLLNFGSDPKLVCREPEAEWFVRFQYSNINTGEVLYEEQDVNQERPDLSSYNPEDIWRAPLGWVSSVSEVEFHGVPKPLTALMLSSTYTSRVATIQSSAVPLDDVGQYINILIAHGASFADGYRNTSMWRESSQSPLARALMKLGTDVAEALITHYHTTFWPQDFLPFRDLYWAHNDSPVALSRIGGFDVESASVPQAIMFKDSYKLTPTLLTRLMADGLNINAPIEGHLPLQLAISGGDTAKARMLMLYGANPNIMIQLVFGSVPPSRLLQQHQQQQLGSAAISSVPLLLVPYNEHYDTQRYSRMNILSGLVQSTVYPTDFTVRDARTGNTVLIEMIKAFVRQSREGNGMMQAWGVDLDEEFVQELQLLVPALSRGLYINAQNNQGETALHYAALIQSPTHILFDQLVVLGANPAIADSRGLRPNMNLQPLPRMADEERNQHHRVATRTMWSGTGHPRTMGNASRTAAQATC